MGIRTGLGLILVACCAVAVEARTWTDSQGRTIEAELVRVSGDSVIFKKGGEEVTVLMSQLSDKDQRYLRRTTKKKSLTGAKGTAVLKKRTWTDDQGIRTEAKFVRVHNDNVILLRGARTITVPFWKFSKTDQEYVAAILKEKGQEVPPSEPPKRTNTNGGLAGGSGIPGGGGVPGGGVPSRGFSGGIPTRGFSGGVPTGRVPTGGPPSRAGSTRSSGMSRSQQIIEASRKRSQELQRRIKEGNDRQREALRKLSEQSRQSTADQMNRLAKGSTAGSRNPLADTLGEMSKPNVPNSSTNDMFSGQPKIPDLPSTPVFESVKKCSSCNSTVPSHLGAGDRCPKCGVFFSFEEDSFGNTTSASGFGRAPWIGGGILAILAIVGIVVKVIVAFARA